MKLTTMSDVSFRDGCSRRPQEFGFNDRYEVEGVTLVAPTAVDARSKISLSWRLQ